MKSIAFILGFIFISLTSFAQFEKPDSLIAQPVEQKFDSGTVKIRITFLLKHHLDIIEAQRQSGTIGQPETINYANQVWRQMDTVYSPNQSITVAVSSAFIRDNYRLMGSQQERIAAEVNEQMRQALLPQIVNYSWLYAEIVKIATENQALIDRRRMSAYEAGKTAIQ